MTHAAPRGRKAARIAYAAIGVGNGSAAGWTAAMAGAAMWGAGR